MARRESTIVLVDRIKKPWPSAASLISTGVPLAVARVYQKARRDITVGLKKRIKERVN
jgi:hypothetical protein